MEKTLRPVISVRIFREEKCFGPGVAALLKNIEEHHSLRSAAASMSMAYSKAWTILKTSEAELGFKLLHTTTGGRHGGGAALTPEAQALLEAYTAYCAALKSAGKALFEEHFREFL